MPPCGPAWRKPRNPTIAAPAKVSGRIAMLRAKVLLLRDEDLALSIEASEEAIALVPAEKSPDLLGAYKPASPASA